MVGNAEATMFALLKAFVVLRCEACFPKGFPYTIAPQSLRLSLNFTDEVYLTTISNEKKEAWLS